ncbi:MAG: hypothetical protein K5637_06060 [Lachnospiraceae bacterium]|nr:hypothetical protein [Lachnospiraceae bacterium]
MRNRFFRRPVPKEAAFTVEAALIVPFITILIIACLFLAFYCHDRTVSQSYAFRAGEMEAVKYAGEDAALANTADGPPAAMSSVTKEITSDRGSLIGTVIDLAMCRKTASCSVSGSLDVSLLRGTVSGLSSFSCTGTVKKISYPDDMLLSGLIDALKE